MGPTSLVLIRHAQMEHNGGGPEARLCGWCDAPLTALGRGEADLLSVRLAGDPAVALYSSPLRRAADTARAISARLGLPIHFDPSLREIYCGVLDGVLLAEVQKDHPDIWKRNLSQSDDGFGWPGGESYVEFRTRVLDSIRFLASRHPGSRVLVVTHAGVISQVLGALVRLSPARWEAFRPGNASVTEVLWKGQSGSLVRFDDRTHLSRAA